MQPTELPLRDIQIPDAISAWPPAIGWWVLAVLIPRWCYLRYRLYRRLTRKTALKAAKKQFKILRDQSPLSKQEKLIELSSLMRRTAVSLYPRTDVAGLTGEQWINFLNQSAEDPDFNGRIAELFTDSLYSKAENNFPLAPLFAACESWLNYQKEPKI